MPAEIKKNLLRQGLLDKKNLAKEVQTTNHKPVEARLVGQAVETAREAPGELLPSTWLLFIRSSTPM